MILTYYDAATSSVHGQQTSSQPCDDDFTGVQTGEYAD